MKKISFTLFFFILIIKLNAQVKFTALTFTPQFPQANSKISFEYNSNYSPLIGQKNIEVVVYLFNEKGQNGFQIVEPKMQNKSGIFSGTFNIDCSTNVIAFSFIAGEIKDVNGDSGYLVPIYSKDKTQLANSYKWTALIQYLFGSIFLGLPANGSKAVSTFDEAFKIYPTSKSKWQYLGHYLSAIEKAKKKEATPLILNELQEFEKKKELDENDYKLLIDWYGNFKKKEKVDSFTILRREKFPDGTWKEEEAIAAFYKETDIEKKKKLFDEYLAKYGSNEMNKFTIASFKEQLAYIYFEINDFTNFKIMTKQMSSGARAMIYNNEAWSLAEIGKNLEIAYSLAKEAADYSKTEITNPTEKKPDNLTNKKWEEQRKSSYAMYGDTYAYILYQLKNYKTGFPIAKDAATINKFKDADYNERYALLAEKVLPPAETKKIIENFVKAGTANIKTKEVLKNLYKTEKKSDVDYDAYLAKLEAASKEAKKAEVIKSMINEVSPKFVLKDFEGKEVSLESLKGKTVVVDFWATWCDPCIASMPGMNKALTKYKDNENVKFLFVDTWENVEDKLKNAKDFMEKKKYPFYVLMDNENKMVEDFKVSGIPTKFIIDKNGKIRFKAVGFSGNDDELVDELSTMIEIASK